MAKLPPIRESEDHIQIDQKKGEWPFVHIVRLDDGSVQIGIDSNEEMPRIGAGNDGLAVILISAKKARRLREFLERTEA